MKNFFLMNIPFSRVGEVWTRRSSIFPKHPFRQAIVLLFILYFISSCMALNGYIVRHGIESIPPPNMQQRQPLHFLLSDSYSMVPTMVPTLCCCTLYVICCWEFVCEGMWVNIYCICFCWLVNIAQCGECTVYTVRCWFLLAKHLSSDRPPARPAAKIGIVC